MSERFRIAVLLDHIESDYHTEILAGALRAARTSPVEILVVPGGRLTASPDEPSPRNFIYDLVLAARVDGLVILGGSLSNFCGLGRFRAWARRFEPTPCIAIGLDLHDLPHVRVENESAVRALVSHLIEQHDRRRLAFVRGPTESPEANARRSGYLQALSDHGIPANERLIVPGGLERKHGTAAVAQLFDERGFTVATLNAIVAVNDDVALGAIEELARRGIAVPDSMSVVGFDDAESARIANPPMTTVSQRVELQAFTAMRSLIDTLESGQALSSVVLQAETVVRMSCGCARHRDASRGGDPARLTLARSCRLALVERRDAITAEMVRAAAGRIVGMPGWESRLFGALERNLASDDGNFEEVLERMVRRQLSFGHGHVVFHDVLTALRVQVLACAAVEPEIRPRVGDIFQDARLTVARASIDVERDRQRTTSLRMRNITNACLAQLGSGALGDLIATLEEHLPAMGIPAFSISRFHGDHADRRLELVARHSALSQVAPASRGPASELGLDPMFEQQKAIVIEPLEFGGQPVGIAAFAWGAEEPVHYEELRELLSAAIHALP